MYIPFLIALEVVHHSSRPSLVQHCSSWYIGPSENICKDPLHFYSYSFTSPITATFKWLFNIQDKEEREQINEHCLFVLKLFIKLFMFFFKIIRFIHTLIKMKFIEEANICRHVTDGKCYNYKPFIFNTIQFPAKLSSDQVWRSISACISNIRPNANRIRYLKVISLPLSLSQSKHDLLGLNTTLPVFPSVHIFDIWSRILLLKTVI